jgi:hypothetical protein
MTVSSKPFANKKVLEIKGRKMAYIDEGAGDPLSSSMGIRPRPTCGVT